MVARTIPLSGATTPKLALERDFLRLELESDALSVINALLDGEESFADDGHLFNGIKHLM